MVIMTGIPTGGHSGGGAEFVANSDPGAAAAAESRNFRVVLDTS